MGKKRSRGGQAATPSETKSSDEHVIDEAKMYLARERGLIDDALWDAWIDHHYSDGRVSADKYHSLAEEKGLRGTIDSLE